MLYKYNIWTFFTHTLYLQLCKLSWCLFHINSSTYQDISGFSFTRYFMEKRNVRIWFRYLMNIHCLQFDFQIFWNNLQRSFVFKCISYIFLYDFYILDISFWWLNDKADVLSGFVDLWIFPYVTIKRQPEIKRNCNVTGNTNMKARGLSDTKRYFLFRLMHKNKCVLK